MFCLEAYKNYEAALQQGLIVVSVMHQETLHLIKCSQDAPHCIAALKPKTR